MAFLDLPFHVLLNLVQGHMTRSFNKCLHMLLPCPDNQFAHRVKFGELGFIVCIINGARTQTISQRDSHIVLRQNIADVIKMLVQERFLVVNQAPFAHDATAPTHDTAQTLVGQMDILPADAGMNGKIIHALLALLNECIFIDFPREIFYLPVYLLQGLIDRYGSDRHRAVAHDPFARLVDIGTG